MDLSGFDKQGYIRRIRWLRRLHDMNQTQFAAFIGINYKKWHHYEQGYPVSRETAFLLRAKITQFAFSTDWLWHGDTRALERDTLDRLRSFEREERHRLPVAKPLPTTPVRRRVAKTDRKR